MQFSRWFNDKEVVYSFSRDIRKLDGFIRGRKAVLVTDANLHALYGELFSQYSTIVVEAGEEHKTLATVEYIAEQLIQLQADRNTVLVAVGGGVVTDIAGFAASVYMRGIPFGFVPTSLLGMVDAAVGGKNGVDQGEYKNMLGIIRQPEFIFFQTDFLDTLPAAEWSHGFAEVIKYGCIFDKALFEELSHNNIEHYRNNIPAAEALIHRCVEWKNKTVQEDEQEQGIRKLLNFGHTAGHAIETTLGIPHGQAISVGMIIACLVSEKVAGLKSGVMVQLEQLLARYDLPTRVEFNTEEIMYILKMDKKRAGEEIDFIVLDAAGSARVQRTPLGIISEALNAYRYAGGD